MLTGNSLRYYKDAKAEETNSLDGRIDLSSCYEIAEVQIQRNYGFKIKVIAALHITYIALTNNYHWWAQVAPWLS